MVFLKLMRYPNQQSAINNQHLILLMYGPNILSPFLASNPQTTS